MKKVIISTILALALAIPLTVPAAAAPPFDVPPASAPPGPTIVDVALEVNAATGEFSMLIAAILAADPAVFATLSGRGQFTVFAPTDAAFAAIGVEDPEYFEGLDQKVLTDILLYHVARGRRDSEDVLASSRIRMMQGGFLLQNGGVLTDNLGGEANIIGTDVEAANGIIHVIDAVVFPYNPES